MYTVNWSFWSPCLVFFFDNDWLIEVLKSNISTGEAYSSARICLCISRLCGLLLVSSPLWFPSQRRMNLIAWPEPFYLHSEICTCVCGRRGQSKGHCTACGIRPVIHPPSSDRRRKTPVKGWEILERSSITPRKAASDCSSEGKGTVEKDARQWERKPEVLIYTHTYQVHAV